MEGRPYDDDDDNFSCHGTPASVWQADHELTDEDAAAFRRIIDNPDPNAPGKLSPDMLARIKANRVKCVDDKP